MSCPRRKFGSACVCVQDAQKKSVYTQTQNSESAEGGVCENAHTRLVSLNVCLVSIVLVLVWYQSCSLVNHCSTRSSTTNEVVR
jgi:hypothetical protein